MIDVKSLFKFEGKHKGKVKVMRDGKTFYREQMLGRKESEYNKLKKEYDQLKSEPIPKNETIDQMIDRTDKINAVRRKMNAINPQKIIEAKKYKEEYERQKNIPKPKKERIDINKIKKGMIIQHEDENQRWEVIKVMRVNVQLLPLPTLPSDNPIIARKDELQYYIEINKGDK